MPKISQHHIFRLMDLLALVASNAYTACVAGIIALTNSPEAVPFFPIGTLSKLALGATLLFEAVATSVWLWHNHQCNKVLKAAGLASNYLNNKGLNAALSDPLHRQQYSAANLNKNRAMSSMALCGLLLMAGMLAAMYLSNTSLTQNGSIDGDFGYAIYAAPAIGSLLFLFFGIVLHRQSLKAEINAQQWICLSTRPPKTQDIKAGFVRNLVLCRAPSPIKNWGGCYRVFKINQINGKHMPPPHKREGIEWTPLQK